MPLPLRDHAARLAATLLAAGQTLLCTDFDGTLVPICDDPDECVLDDATRAILAAIHRPPRIHVAVVSGRRLDDVRRRVGVAEITYAGNHGLEIEGDGLVFQEPTAVACQGVMESLVEDLHMLTAGIDGAWLEPKGLSLTLHYRQVREEAVPALHAGVARIASRAIRAGRLRMHRGKSVIELRPDVPWDKGRAMEWIAEQLACDRRSRVFIGDDETDEDAFDVCRDGTTIRVGYADTPTAARYIAGPDDVRWFLTMILQGFTGDASYPLEASVDRDRLPGDECRGR